MSKFSVILLLFVLALYVSAGAQSESVGMGMAAPGVIAKPSFETTESGLLLKVWIMSVIDDAMHIDTNAVQTDSDTDEQKHVTHHIIAEVRDAAEGKEVSGANVRLEILSPTGKTDNHDLETMTNQYGGDILLTEKGEYKLKLSVNTEDGRNIKAPFSYKVR